MDAKLTLNVDKDLVGKAKLYAKAKGRSLSDLVEMYFKAITHKKVADDIPLSPKVKSLLGSIKVPDNFDYKQELSEQLTQKYL